MVSAELAHNPYLLITEVRFNGKPPRINSQIEKHRGKPLKDWVSLVPDIFYQEMNGYDFDLYFMGTKSDFNEVQEAFLAAGVSQKEVRLFHKRELEDPEKKDLEITALLQWMQQHPNRKFDAERFQEQTRELFEGKYPYVILHGSAPENPMPSVCAETVAAVQELKDTVLNNTPIVLVIDKENEQQAREDLQILMDRKDVREEQLFFRIDAGLNSAQVKRVISDLGITSPQVIRHYEDDVVQTFLRNYPVTEYIRQSILAFRGVTNQIELVLSEESKERSQVNEDIHLQITALDRNIGFMKQAAEQFLHRDNYDTPQQFWNLYQELEEKIQKWKNRRTKVVGEEEAEIAAQDYERSLQKEIGRFGSAMAEAVQSAGREIEERFAQVYEWQGHDVTFRPSKPLLGESPPIVMPSITQELLDLKEISYTESKNDFLGKLRKSGDKSSAPVRVVTYYYGFWRTKAAECLLPRAEDLVKECTEMLKSYYDGLSEGYHVHLEQMITEKTAERERIASQLSLEEQKHQEDRDWLTAVQEQLLQIERG